MASYGERRRHHRVGEKTANIASHKSCCFKHDKHKLIAGAIALGGMLFIKGLLIGMLISRDQQMNKPSVSVF